MVVRGVLKVKLGALLKCQGPMDISRIIINLPSGGGLLCPFGE